MSDKYKDVHNVKTDESRSITQTTETGGERGIGQLILKDEVDNFSYQNETQEVTASVHNSPLEL